MQQMATATMALLLIKLLRSRRIINERKLLRKERLRNAGNSRKILQITRSRQLVVVEFVIICYFTAVIFLFLGFSHTFYTTAFGK